MAGRCGLGRYAILEIAMKRVGRARGWLTVEVLALVLALVSILVS
jgi:hypothetical protein